MSLSILVFMPQISFEYATLQITVSARRVVRIMLSFTKPTQSLCIIGDLLLEHLSSKKHRLPYPLQVTKDILRAYPSIYRMLLIQKTTQPINEIHGIRDILFSRLCKGKHDGTRIFILLAICFAGGDLSMTSSPEYDTYHSVNSERSNRQTPIKQVHYRARMNF